MAAFIKNALSYEEVLKLAAEQFATSPQKEAIIARIATRLDEEDYRNCVNEGIPVEITLNWEDILWGPERIGLSEEAMSIIRETTLFIQNLPGVGVFCLK